LALRDNVPSIRAAGDPHSA